MNPILFVRNQDTFELPDDGGDLLGDRGKSVDRVEDEVVRRMVDAGSRGREIFRRLAEVAARVAAGAEIA